MSNGMLFAQTLNTIGCDLEFTLSNFASNHHKSIEQHYDIEYTAKLFSQNGECIAETSGEVKKNTVLHLKQSTLFNEIDTHQEYLLAFDFTTQDGLSKPLIHEHQIKYHHKKSGKFCSVVFDNIPFNRGRSKILQPIVGLLYKTWTSSDMNTLVCINTRLQDANIGDRCKLEYFLLNENGDVLYQNRLEIPVNCPFMIDIATEESKMLRCIKNDRMRYYNLCIKLYDASAIIYNVLHNESTGNLAIEHSLSPPYYTELPTMQLIKQTALSNFSSVL